MSEVEYENMVGWVHEQDGKTLLRVQKEITKALEKCIVKERKGAPKGVVPSQLVCPKAWIDFTLLHAQKHGWESFEQKTSRKDKGTGKMETMMVEMPWSVLSAEGAHIFEGSVTEKDPFGKCFVQQNAMSLSKQRWDSKNKVGTHEELYGEFMVEFESVNQPLVKEIKEVVKITAEEKEAASVAKKAAEVEKKKREKEAKDAEKKLLKDREEAKKALAKELEKREKDAAIRAKQLSKIVRADQVETKLTPPTPSKEKKETIKKVKKEKNEKWVAPTDGTAKGWEYKEKMYYRNIKNEVYKKGENGAPEWIGKYIEEEDRIDDEAEEPMSDDEEEAEENHSEDED